MISVDALADELSAEFGEQITVAVSLVVEETLTAIGGES